MTEQSATPMTLGDYCQHHRITRVDGVLILQLWRELVAGDDSRPDPQSLDALADPPPSIQRMTERVAKHLADARRAQAQRDTIWRHLSGIDLPDPIASRAAERFASGDSTISEAVSAAIEDHLTDLHEVHQRIVNENERLRIALRTR